MLTGDNSYTSKNVAFKSGLFNSNTPESITASNFSLF